MARREILRELSAASASTPSERIAWLVESRFFGNRSEFAREIGFSHSIVGRVARGRTPGKHFRDAVVARLGVNRDWLDSGTGTPFFGVNAMGPIPSGSFPCGSKIRFFDNEMVDEVYIDRVLPCLLPPGSEIAFEFFVGDDYYSFGYEVSNYEIRLNGTMPDVVFARCHETHNDDRTEGMPYWDRVAACGLRRGNAFTDPFSPKPVPLYRSHPKEPT